MARPMMAAAALLLAAGPAAAQQYQTLNTSLSVVAWNTTTAAWSAGSSTNSIGSTFTSTWAAGNFATFARDSQAVTVAAPVTAAGLQFVANNVTVGGSSAITLSYTNPFIDNRGGGANTVISAPVTGTSGLVAYNAAGTRLTLAGVNTYTGTTTASLGGTLAAGTNTSGSFGAFGSINNDLTVNGGAAADLSGLAVGVGALNGTGAVTNSSAAAATLTAGNGNANATFGGSLTGNLGLTKAGTGTLTLTEANTYTRPTTVSAGTLAVANATGSGTGAGAVSVGAAGTLTGTGTVAGATTVNAGGDLAAGAVGTAGRLTFGGGLTLAAGSTLHVDVAGPAAGAGYDQVRLTGGAAALGGATLSLDTLGGTGYTPATRLVIVDAPNGGISGTFAGLPDGSVALTNFGGFAQWGIFYDAPAGDVYLTPVPEPGTVLGVAAIGLGVLRRLRTRRPGSLAG